MGCPVDNLNMDESLERIDHAIQHQQQIHHTVVNAGKMVMMQKDQELNESVVSADMINADGQAVVWAAKVLGTPLKERVAGIDLMESLVEKAHEKGYKIFFFGAKEEVVKEVVDRYSKTYSPDIVAGYRNGYFKEEEKPAIAKQIADSGANLLFVAISSPTKEIFLNSYKKELSKLNFIMGVGGSFDVVAGKVKRAPIWMQKAGLEWFYRFLQEPGRMWKRYLIGNTRFVLLVMSFYFNKSKA
jgi:N-acetylglucosaminyldiphosphoundecaprenol N-acetyl-beta-D-mannosaminyltransferase